MSSISNISFEFNDFKVNGVELCDENVKGDIFEKKISDDLFIIKSSLNLNNEISYESDLLIDGLVFNYCMEGLCTYQSLNSNFKIDTRQYDSHIFLSKRDNIRASISKGHAKTISMVIKKDFIEKNMPNTKIKDKIINNLDKNISNELIIKNKSNIQKRFLINTIYDSPFIGNLDGLYLQSKALECIYWEFHDFINIHESKNKNIKLDKQDIDAIKKAKKILLNNMQNPPSIVQLAKQVRLNEFKLKIGFKKVFNDTPYNILLDHRLQLSKKLLEKSDMNIEEISRYIGYKYSSSFTKAFTKRYGLRPVDIMKKRTYYY